MISANADVEAQPKQQKQKVMLFMDRQTQTWKKCCRRKVMFRPRLSKFMCTDIVPTSVIPPVRVE
jgi:hypothetical protein